MKTYKFLVWFACWGMMTALVIQHATAQDAEQAEAITNVSVAQPATPAEAEQPPPAVAAEPAPAQPEAAAPALPAAA